MTVPTGTVQTYAMGALKENVGDIIYNVDPDEVPFLSMLKRGKAKATTPEWVQDSLAAASGDNKVIEGDDATNDTAKTPSKLRNYTQISDKVYQTSSTSEAVDKYGRKKEMAYNLIQGGKELKLDIETRLLGNYASHAGAAGTARECGGVGAWIETNYSLATAGAPAIGGYNTGTDIVDARTTGTAENFTEARFKDVIKQCWDSGGSPEYVFCNSFQKQVLSGFLGIATQYRENTGIKQGTILGAADVYVSDFGVHKVVPCRQMPTDSVYIMDMKYWKFLELNPMKSSKLAKTGHSDRRMLATEYTLAALNEKTSGGVFDNDVT